jgi:hypothetical protein
MRNLLASFLLALTAAQAVGGERKPNTLTLDELRAGWILLFDGETNFGWMTGLLDDPRQMILLPGGPALLARQFNPPEILKGTLRLDKDGVISNTCRFGEFEMRFQYRSVAEDSESAASFTVIGLEKKDRQISLQSSTKLLNVAAEWREATARIVDGKFHFLWDAKGGHSSTERINKGLLAIGFSGKSLLRGVRLRPLNSVFVFNAKDLTGWQIFPGKKSKFTVEEGAITIKDGPGDLQTVGKYKDFILQLECKSNGKHLNSGVFFRCRDGEYQNGYEAQIRNQFTAEPKQVYTIEEYDPKTHELIAKKKVKYAAVDYGTGAIYRRQPARREVAKDGEWFTMTILAHGNHFATWVNGIQVTDWTDNRPPSDNARTGFRREAGHISLQGHDPTTNLSFRNLRIAELK